MAQVLQITLNEILSGISKAIYDVFGEELFIYLEQEEKLELPAVAVYCMDYKKVMERNDRWNNTFNIIINYFPTDSVIINNKRTEMFRTAEKIMDAITYINLPAYQKDNEGNFLETTLKSRAQDLGVEEREGFIQITATFVVRTRKHTEYKKMQQLDLEVTNK